MDDAERSRQIAQMQEMLLRQARNTNSQMMSMPIDREQANEILQSVPAFIESSGTGVFDLNVDEATMSVDKSHRKEYKTPLQEKLDRMDREKKEIMEMQNQREKFAKLCRYLVVCGFVLGVMIVVLLAVKSAGVF